MQEGGETIEFTELEARASKIDYETICGQVLELNREMDELGQEIAKTNAEISELNPWVKLETPIKDLELFKQVEALLGTIPKKLRQNVENDLSTTEYTYFEVLSEDKDNLNVLLLIHRDELEKVRDILRSYSFSNTKINIEGDIATEIAKFEEEINQLKEEISQNKGRLENLTEELSSLQIVYEYLMNVKLKLSTSENFLKPII